jgi:hypothetical protein
VFVNGSNDDANYSDAHRALGDTAIQAKTRKVKLKNHIIEDRQFLSIVSRTTTIVFAFFVQFVLGCFFDLKLELFAG